MMLCFVSRDKFNSIADFLEFIPANIKARWASLSRWRRQPKGTRRANGLPLKLVPATRRKGGVLFSPVGILPETTKDVLSLSLLTSEKTLTTLSRWRRQPEGHPAPLWTPPLPWRSVSNCCFAQATRTRENGTSCPGSPCLRLPALALGSLDCATHQYASMG